MPDIGLYTIDTVTEIPQIDPVTGENRIIESTFDINVLSDCWITSFVYFDIPNMVNGVTLPIVSETAFFTDVTANKPYNADPLYCGLRDCTLNPIHSFMNVVNNGADITIDVETWDPADIGFYPGIEVTCKFVDYPSLPAVTDTFDVTINCGVQTLNWADSLGNIITDPFALFTTLEVGIDAQPLTMPFQTVQYPNCGNDVTYTITLVNDPLGNGDPFRTLNVDADPSYTGDFTVNGATIEQHGVYTYRLDAEVDGQVATTTFDVFIKDPCSTSTFEDVNPLIDMGFIMYYMTTEVQTQPVKIWTDLERATGIYCPVKYTLTGYGVNEHLFMTGDLLTTTPGLITLDG